MVVTVAQVVTILQGEPNGLVAPDNGWFFFRLYDIKETTIQILIDMVTRWASEEIAAATQADKADLFDDMILNYTCLRLILAHIMGGIMVAGFSFTSVELTINAANFDEVIKAMARGFLLESYKILRQLKNRVEIFDQEEWGVDPYDISSNNFFETAPARR